jgi:hypothetical protein
VTHVTALLLDLANIVGGFLLGAVLLADLPSVGPWVARGAAAITGLGRVVGVVALMMGGFYVIMHLTSGPHVFHFELVGVGVGVALLRDRLFPRVAGLAGPVTTPTPTAPVAQGPASLFSPVQASGGVRPGTRAPPTGGALLLAVFGLIAIVVGLQGLFTPDQ